MRRADLRLYADSRATETTGLKLNLKTDPQGIHSQKKDLGHEPGPRVN